MKKSFIVVTTKREGFHFYPDAPDEVDFLRHIHRHLFTVTASIEVFSSRELEFFMVQRTIANFVSVVLSESASCEEYADRILEWARSTYGNRDITVEVSEDGENSARVQYTP
jgi:hypothetical protein